MTLYGLKACDTCRKALKALDGRDVAFVDVRADGVPPETLAGWIAKLGPDALVNRRSTTWRGLPEAERAQAETAQGAAALLARHPALMKRPVTVAGGALHVGWDSGVRAALGL
ncbi:arsenate reductase [Limibaculum sp. M0105]|uniref:Arsenate reductase n=1 Tax=Thermohalobaculum xanthum TaxID=2753746 RepID=A0A8J7SG79_9RHOB|nr:ArsC/Spx/MgsR family protein [Thermohalobaculum xanthum]MBK0400666.1 arsenate reductase [Thermohalobaculum xanthum]